LIFTRKGGADTMNTNLPASDKFAVLGVAGPAVGTDPLTTGWVPVKDFYQMMAVIACGTLGADATLDAKLEQAKDDSGTDAEDVTGKAITQLTKAGGDDEKQSVINFRPEDLSDGFTHVQLKLAPAVADTGAAGVLLGCEPRYSPASGFDAESVAEIVA
jgi:hypothetical protein